MPLPAPETLRFLVSRFARLYAAHGDVLREPDLVEPTGKFFPDAFTPDPESVERLVRRTMSYVPLPDNLNVSLAFREPETSGGGCGSGACGPSAGGAATTPAGLIDRGDGYTVEIMVAHVGDPLLLTASIARSVGAMVLAEASYADDVTSDPRERGGESEIVASACGLGVVLLNGASVYRKGCSGMKSHQATHLSVDELATLVALFVRMHGHARSRVRTHLEVTQREAFDEALRWVDSNPELVARLCDHPSTLEDGVFAVETTKGFFGRIFAKKATRAPEEALPVARPKTTVRTPEQEARLREAKALVEEALREGG